MVDAQLMSLLRELIRVAFSAQRDVWTLELALRETGVLTPEQIAAARVSVDEQLQNQENAERLLNMLRDFEGPPQ